MSSDNADHTTSSTSFPQSSSLFAYTPRLSPSSSRRTSPARRPLHDRSNSQTNQFANPTIRIVEDPASEVYSKTPFPSQPSQILPPRNAPGYVFEARGARVSDGTLVANAVSSTEPIQTLVPKPLQPKRAFRHSTSTNTSDADTLVAAASFSPSSSRFSQGTTPPSSPAPFPYDKETVLALVEEKISQADVRPTIRPVPPSASSDESELQGHALTPRASAASLASSASSESANYHEYERTDDSPTPQRPRPSPPPPSDHNNSQSSGTGEKKQASSTNKAPARPTLKTSSESLAFSDISYESSDPPQIRYPTIRQPSANSLWAKSQVLPKKPSRMNDRASQVHQWSSQLSTIPSESERGSRSIDRRSRSVDAGSLSNEDHTGRSNIPRRRETITSIASSEIVASESGAESSVSVPLPLFSPIVRPSDGRDSDEHHDTVSPLQSPPLRTKHSGYLKRKDSDSRSTSSRPDSSPRPGSSQSDLATFISNTIPAWARVYYRRGERTSVGAPESTTDGSESVRVPTATSGRSNTPSEGGWPLSIYRPRNRPHQRRQSQPNTDSMAISEAPVEQDIYVIGPPRRPMNEPFTPRLRQDRRSTAVLSAWKAPSFDDSLRTLFFSRRNRQILLFCLGFLCPLAWIIASVLPLPKDPNLVHETPSQLDLERQFAAELGPLDDRTYQKAMWWRNLNRVMSAIGTLLIGVIIALAVLASRM